MNVKNKLATKCLKNFRSRGKNVLLCLESISAVRSRVQDHSLAEVYHGDEEEAD